VVTCYQNVRPPGNSSLLVRSSNNPKDFPDGLAKNCKSYSTYFSGHPNPKQGKTSKVCLKAKSSRTNQKQPLSFELEQMGQELAESGSDEMTVTLARNPCACQAIKSECVGWFFGSAKSIDSKIFVVAIRDKLKIPCYVAVGAQWRTIKDENRKNYEGKEEEPLPPSHAPGHHRPHAC
jgi:hypothetical protein